MSASDAGLFGPDSVTWRLHADPSMLIGGLRALLLQALEPRAMAGVDQHSDYRGDPWGRLQRTADYVVTVSFADTATAERAAAHVRGIHRRVVGVDPHTAATYSATDSDLLVWVHAVLADSILAAYRRYGGRLGRHDGDRYLVEQVRAAELMGLKANQVPTTEAAMADYMADAEGRLDVSPAARRGSRLIFAPPMPLVARPLWLIPTTAAVALLPRRARALYGLPWFPPADAAVRPSVYGLLRLLNVVLPSAPALRAARRRIAA